PTVSGSLGTEIFDKGQTVSAEFELAKYLPSNLSWSHYERLMRIEDDNERDWYMREAAGENWSVRTLNRNIGSQYYNRLLQTPEPKRGEVISEMKRLTADYQKDRHNFLRNPVIAEFLGFSQDAAYSENNLETAIIDHLQKFILELGKGFAFVARQQRIKTDMGEYYIDLVFYNYILKCFLLIDLKTSQITYSDIGQMDMYIRMYDETKCTEGDNPTIGLLLCSETSKDLARYSILKDSKQLYAAKYLTYLPTKEQLIAEIERQKEIFALQTGKYDQ
ncbi:MAG: PDDEXK nuclease domain-containing protein, partial [Muribaculaceae bacterium]|nr:PDDEXK nuclease domain-containing protein [Muribaculaceae bacterium]